MQNETTAGFFSKRAAATYTTLSPRKLDYCREQGALPFLQVGRRVVFAKKDLDQFMGRFRVDARRPE